MSFGEIVDYHAQLIEGTGADKVVLVGHSGAGLLAAALAKVSSRVCHVVFVAANIPKNGTTAIGVFGPEIQKKTIDAVTAQAEFDRIPVKSLEGLFVNVFGNQCTPEQIAYVLGQDSLPEPVCVLTEKMDWTDYPAVGKTYVVCTNDKTLTEAQQRYLASNLAIEDIRPIAADHLVMISRPDALALELNEIAHRYIGL